MSILPQALQHSIAKTYCNFGRHWLTGSCLLCMADSADQLLCTECLSDLPVWISAQHCPVCADSTGAEGACSTCRKNPPFFDATFAAFRYEFPVDRIIHALKYGHQLPIAQWLGKKLAHAPAASGHDYIMALPLHSDRIKERGFNQSLEIARAMSRLTRQELRIDVLQRIRPTRPQAGLPLKDRTANVQGVFECLEDLRGRSVLLVDDVMTSGATLGECARILKLHGAQRVTLAVAARALGPE